MKRLAIILFAIAFGISGCVQTTESGVSRIKAREAHPLRLNHMDVINTVRAANGLQPVTLSAELTAAAETHARDMAAQLRAWNFGSDRSSPQTRANRAGFDGLVTGENVAETFDSSLEILQIWLADPLARAVMLDPTATHLGLGWYQEPNGKIWWVQDFGAQAAPPEAVTEPVVTAESQ